MLFREYQEGALSTAFDSAKNFDYLAPGLISEVGELCGLFAKAVRDSDSTMDKERSESACAEIGDILWFLAVSDAIGSANGFDVDLEQVEAHADKSSSALLVELSRVSAMMAGEYLTGHTVADKTVLHILQLLQLLANRLGSSVNDLAAHNLAKLRSRAKRGTLRGSGDYR